MSLDKEESHQESAFEDGHLHPHLDLIWKIEYFGGRCGVYFTLRKHRNCSVEDGGLW